MGTLVVEASETSGAKMQARLALRHGRAVFLLRSLVASQKWARKYVEQGAYGAQAIEVSTEEDIVERLDAPEPEELRVPA
jgi:DNA processing protein